MAIIKPGFGVAWLFLFFLPFSFVAGQDQAFTDQQLEFFESRVRPILVERCLDCHGSENDHAEGGLVLESRKAILAGGDSGPAIELDVAPEETLLIDAVNYGDLFEMPPDSKLPQGEIDILTRWVAMGAPWPAESDVAFSKNQDFDIKQMMMEHWCWQPLQKPAVPSVELADWPRDPIDHFILARLEQSDLTPAKPAQRRELIRRAYFDLIGLPPTPEQITDFENDPSPRAFENVVDQLLASPHFGERWARHWMDLTRYAETCGHEFDYPIPYAHEYRDYLIRAFNSDVPYDQLVREHIAGDLLDSPRRHPEDGFNESILGTGFWFLGEATHGPVDVRADEAGHIDNRIDVMSKTFLGLTVACARCHDHKFDPISIKDYYALSGFLQSSRRQLVMLDPHGKIERSFQTADRLKQELQRESDTLVTRLKNVSHDSLSGPIRLAAHWLRQNHEWRQPKRLEFPAKQLTWKEASSGTVALQNLNPQTGNRWHNNQQIWWRGAENGATLHLEFEVNVAATYRLIADFTQARDYGRFRLALDGEQVHESLDLYQTELSKTGPLAIGEPFLAKGKHRLSVTVLAANTQAAPGNMFGLDRLVLERVPDETATNRRHRDLERIASELGLARSLVDDAAVGRWIEQLQSDAAAQPGHPLSVLRLAIDDSTIHATAPKSPTATSTFASFDGNDFEGWYVTGKAFGDRPTQSMEFAPTGIGNLSHAGIAHSGRYGNGFYGVLRSPTFEIQHPHIHYRVNGKQCEVRLVIDGYVLDVYNALLFNGVTRKVDTNGQFQWITQSGDIKNYIGHRAHIEVIDHGPGFIAVDEIHFSDGPAPQTNPSWFEGDSRSELDFDQRIIARTQAMCAMLSRPDTWQPQEYAIVNFLLKNQLVPVAVSDRWLTGFQTHDDSVPRPRFAVGMTDGTGEDEFVFVRGNHKNLGGKAPRRIIEALAGDEVPEFDEFEGSQRRYLANKINARSNPLTHRVIANRIWHHLTGRGIVYSVDNFGVLGSPPSHPELLDYLASEFLDDDQSLKRLLKRIMLTQTYQMSSTASCDARDADPDNVLLHKARVRRLQAESIRDAMLQVSGRLDRTQFGKPVPIHLTPFMQGRGRPGKSGPLDGDGRRSIYIEVRRNFLSPMMLAFDTPIPFNSIGRRNNSNVPAQALILLNDPLVLELAKAWANEVAQWTDLDIEGRIRRIYMQGIGREPTSTELDNTLTFMKDQAKALEISLDEAQPTNVELWRDVCHVMFNLKEFIYLN